MIVKRHRGVDKRVSWGHCDEESQFHWMTRPTGARMIAAERDLSPALVTLPGQRQRRNRVRAPPSEEHELRAFASVRRIGSRVTRFMIAADERMVFFDTNVLLYSISGDAAEAEKRERAIALLDRDDGALSVQVVQEFYVQATRPSRPDRLPHDLAAGLIKRWARLRVQEMNLAILNAAL